MNMSGHVLSAIRDFENLLKYLEKGEKSEVGKSFRSRCKEMPNLIEDVGLVPALSFCYAKAGRTIYNEVKNALERGIRIDDKKHTEKGYGIYLYLVLKRLRELKLIGEDHLDDPIKAFEEIEKGKQRIAEELLRPYMVQMKKLSEAVFEVEGLRK